MPDMSDATISFPILGEKFILDFKPYFVLFGWKFYWYGIIIALGFLLAVIYAFKRAKQFGLNDDNIVDLLIYAVPIGVVGARLYYVVFYDWSFKGSLWENIVRIVNIREGGLAIYGGVIFAFIGALIFSRVKKVKLGAVADISGLGLLIGQAVGRWGNFVNREAFGYKTSVPWKMGLTNQYGTFYYHPAFLYESLWNVLGFILLHFYSKRRKFDGEVFIMYLGWYGLGRLYIEGLRQDSLFLFGTQLRVSQLVALI
jgi:phosphatidylglycerol:prolipoprotein diacylglycerol transferase